MVALALLASGCGRAYSEADVQRALGLSERATVHFYVDGSEPAAQTVFATFNAVTELVIEETPPLPQAVYDGDGVYIERYGSSHDAWLAAHRASSHTLAFIVIPGQRVSFRVYANLVVVGESGRVNATIAQLH